MTEVPEVDAQAVRDRATGMVLAIVTLINIDQGDAAIELVGRELRDAFEGGFYAGIEAWDLAHKANGSQPAAGQR
jgi:hypothetical protein